MGILDYFKGKAPKPSNKNQTESNAQTQRLMSERAEHPAKGLSPSKLYSILQDAEAGDLRAQHELFADMEERDSQIGADLGKRVALSAGKDWDIIPPKDASPTEQKATDFCLDVFQSLEVEDLIINMGSAVGHGWSNLEYAFQTDGRYKVIDQPVFRPHGWFELDENDQNKLLLRSEDAGIELNPLGWVRHVHRAKAGYIARMGLHRMLVWPYLFQNYAVGDLAELLEIYGIPAKIGRYPSNATPDEKDTLLRAVVELGHSAAGIIPQGMEIEFLEAAQGKSDMFKAMLDWCENAKARVILGNTLTSGTGQGTNTNALGNVHQESQDSLIANDCRQYASTIKRDLLMPLVAVNFGITDLRRVPSFNIDTSQPEDFEMLANAIPKFVGMGAKIPVKWLHKKAHIPEAEADEEILALPKDVGIDDTVDPTGTDNLGEFGRHYCTGQRPLASLASEQKNSPDGQLANRLGIEAGDALKGWIEQIQHMADEAESLEQLQDMILSAYQDMDNTQLANVMEFAFSVATAHGHESVIQDTENHG